MAATTKTITVASDIEEKTQKEFQIGFSQTIIDTVVT